MRSEFVDPDVPEALRRQVLDAAFDELTRWGLERFSVATMCARHGIEHAVVARQINTHVGRSVMRAMVVDDRAAFADDTRMEFWKQRFNAMRLITDRAAQRGELRAGVDALAAVQLVIAPLNIRALYTREPVEEAYCQSIADLAWHAIKS